MNGSSTRQYSTGTGSSERHRYHVATLRQGCHSGASLRMAAGAMRSAVVVMQRDGALEADVVDRQHVGAQFVEDQEHLGGPAADALDLGQRRDQRLVVELPPALRVERSRGEVRSEIAQILGLAFGQTAVAQCGDVDRGDPARVELREGGRLAAGATAATNRRQIASAALTEICWPTMARASVVKGIAAALEVNVRAGPDKSAQHAVALGRACAWLRPSTTVSRVRLGRSAGLE